MLLFSTWPDSNDPSTKIFVAYYYLSFITPVGVMGESSSMSNFVQLHRVLEMTQVLLKIFNNTWADSIATYDKIFWSRNPRVI